MFYIATKDVLNASCNAPTGAFKNALLELIPSSGYSFKEPPTIQAVNAVGVFVALPFTLAANGTYTLQINDQTYTDLGYPDERLCALDIQAIASLDDSNTPSYGLIKIYEVTQEQIDQLAKAVWVTLDNKPTQVQLSDNIHSLIKLRLTPDHQPPNYTLIKLGDVTTDIAANQLSTPMLTTDLGSLAINGVYNNALDYSNVTIELYLPFHGIETLDPAKVMNTTIHLTYDTNVMTGFTTITISDPTGLVLYTYTAQCAYQIPIKTTDSTKVSTLEIAPCYSTNTTPTLTLRYNRPCYIDSINNTSKRVDLKSLIGSGYVECHNLKGLESTTIPPQMYELITEALRVGVFF